MFKTFNLCGLALLFVLISISFVYPQTSTEQLVITTYYPSPMGSYNKLQSRSFGVGDNNGDSNFTDADIPTTFGDVWIRGNVGIGNMAPTVALDVSGRIRAGALGTSAIQLCIDGSNNLSTCSSSSKLKVDIQPLNSQDYDRILSEVTDTPLYSFRMKTEGPHSPRHLGVLAEESPQTLKYTDEHGNTNIDFYSYQGAYPWAAVKALVNKIENLETEVKNLKSELSRPK